MDPLAAFQVLALTMAAALAIEAMKPSTETRWRYIFWGLFALFALIGVATNLIAEAWPAASSAMVWVGSSPITFLIVFLGWVAYLQKPWRKAAQSTSGVDLAQVFPPEAEMREDIRKLGLSISGIVDGMTSVSDQQKTDHAVLSNLGHAIEEVRASVSALEAKMVAVNSLNADALRAQFDNVYLALGAIGHWERINRLGNRLDQKAESLSRPTAHPEVQMDETLWRLWVEGEEQWRSDLMRWCELAEPYKRGVTEKILSTPERLYRSDDWKISDDQFPPPNRSNKVHAYKTFRIILSNWRTEWGNVNSRVAQAAFSGRASAIIGGTE